MWMWLVVSLDKLARDSLSSIFDDDKLWRNLIWAWIILWALGFGLFLFLIQEFI